MFLVQNIANPMAYRHFRGKVTVLHHATTIKKNYQVEKPFTIVNQRILRQWCTSDQSISRQRSCQWTNKFCDQAMFLLFTFIFSIALNISRLGSCFSFAKERQKPSVVLQNLSNKFQPSPKFINIFAKKNPSSSHVNITAI